MSAARATVRLLGERVSFRVGRRLVATVGAVLLLLVVCAAIALYTGNSAISVDGVTAILLGDYAGSTSFEIYTVLDVRLPRMLAAVIAGGALGISGAIFQRLTDNPLGSPDLIGFTGGAATGALLVITTGGGLAVGTALGAFAGGVVAAAVILALAWRSGLEGYRLILVGIGVTAVLSAVRAYLLSRADLEDAQAGLRWLTGSLDGRDWGDVGIGAVACLMLVPATILAHRPLDRLAVGSELATAQGLTVSRWRIGIALIGTAWVGVAVVIAGPVAFVALAAPHILRSLTGGAGPLLLSSGLLGGLLLLLADLVGLRLFAPTQLPAGVVTAVVGGAYLLWILQRRRGRTMG
ncbi:iron chelate uptake ABC transporter family permease subunit [Herbiconiux moechotypicola]|uniref:Iron chelate uptake ABC transporter family permease subunit n=1 Tax=Herbiconiux moechotypicola TaxID=637393 RepID=A0ABN3DUT0_9MICO|nr:iron chelate uptake ABC transporter family permease subunit [Herbiconiux moechotypicola]MCS5730585.1 iron chelate uptake ABC transporter family permease subunit [Herbiconiux moechotypicola]